ncbi:MAG: type II toxin-antitoxin system Phd/YefM family antitoxin [Acaryochloris sp. RU_4_1]|nr:type II toxin-antitoxin system Phd/YefM family antitoxin [Acaryochloris sp. RU_4_1]
MKTYSLTDARNRHGEVFDQAIQEPVMLTKQSRPSHVILSAQAYEQITNRLTELEDLAWGQATQNNLSQSSMIGTDRFTIELERLANGEA